LICRHVIPFAFEDVTEVRAARATTNFSAHSHPKRAIFHQNDGVVLGRSIKGWPATTGVKFCLTSKKFGATCFALVDAHGLCINIFAGKWPLGRTLAQDIKGERVYRILQVFIIDLYRICGAVRT
jgi:hypothetical protein